MDPAFRVLTRWNGKLDEEIYDTFPEMQPKEDPMILFYRVLLVIVAIGYLSVQIFVLGMDNMQLWHWVFTLLSVLILILAISTITFDDERRDAYLKKREQKRRQQAGSKLPLTADLFYQDHLQHYNMLTGKIERLNYVDILKIRQAEKHVFLLNEQEVGMICLEKAGFSGKSPIEAVNWLKGRRDTLLKEKEA